MTKKTKLIIIISVVSVLLFSLFVAYLVMRHNGVGQDNILAYEYSLPHGESGFIYNDKAYTSRIYNWSIEEDVLTYMGGYLWAFHPPKYYATEMCADNVEDPIFICANAGGGNWEFVREDFEIPSPWDVTFSTAIVEEQLPIQDYFTSAYDSRLYYKFEFADGDGNPAQLKFADILDPYSGFEYKDRPENFIETGSLILYWHDHPCLYLSDGIYFDGNDYYIYTYGLHDNKSVFYKIVNEQLIEYCKKVHLS